MCNPNNLEAVNGVFGPEVTENVPAFNKLMCFIQASMLLLIVLFVFPAPEPNHENHEKDV
jgi:hypothetical protein